MDNDDDDNEKNIVIAIDSTGIKVTNRGQWMQEKWNIRKKDYLKSCCSKYQDQRNSCTGSYR